MECDVRRVIDTGAEEKKNFCIWRDHSDHRQASPRGKLPLLHYLQEEHKTEAMFIANMKQEEIIILRVEPHEVISQCPLCFK